MSNLENLVFTANTDSLKAAVGVIGEVSKAMLDLGKVNTTLAKTTNDVAKAQANSEKVNQEVAKTAVMEAKASRDVAKAKLEEIKATEASTRATKDNSEVTKESITLSERLTDIRNFMAAGSSKGEASALASAKAQKASNEELAKSVEIQKEIRSLQGGNPFDKSIGGLIALKNELRELNEVQAQYANNSGLTSAQAKTLAQDKLRLGILHEQRGELGLLDAALKQHTANTIAEANAVNTLIAATKEIDRQQRELANSTRAMAKEEEKMLFAMEAINAVRGNGSKAAAQQAINEANYARNVRLSGVSAEEAAKKIKLYGEQQTALAAAEEKHKVDYVTRAVGPQLTDIFSGLATGQQSLYTIAIQQGGQLMDQFALSGIEANKMKEILAQAVPNMLENIKKVAMAFGGILTGAISTVGTAVKDLVLGPLILLKEGFYSTATGEEAVVLATERLKVALSTLINTGIFLVVSAIATLGIAYFEVMKEQDKLSNSLILTGAALGMTKESAIEYAGSLNGITSTKAVAALTEFAEAGIRSDDNLQGLIKSALDLEKYAGVAIADTAKEYKKLQDDPMKALEELGIATGRVSEATLEQAHAYKQVGEDIKLVQLAEEELIRVNQLMADQAKANLSPISQLWLDIKSAIAGAWDEMKTFSTSDSLVTALRTVFQTLAIIVSETWFTIKGVGIEIGGVVAQARAFASLDFSSAASIGEDMKSRAKEARENQDKYVASILQGTTAKNKQTEVDAEQYKSNSKIARDNKVNWDIQKKAQDDILNGSKKILSQKEFIQGKVDDEIEKAGKSILTEKTLALVREDAALKWEKANKEKAKAPNRDNFHLVISPLNELQAVEADYKDSMKNIVGIYASKERSLKSLQSNGLKSTKEYEAEMKTLSDEANNAQLDSFNDYWYKAYDATQKGLARIEKERKDSLAANKNPENVPKINEQASAAAKKLIETDRKFFQELVTNSKLATQKLAVDAEEAVNKDAGAIKKAAHEYEKYVATLNTGLAVVAGENLNSEYRLSLLGKTTEEQLKLTRAYEYRNKLTKVQVDLEKELAKIANDAILQVSPEKVRAAEANAYFLAGEQRKAINLSVAVTAAEDFRKEMEKVSKPISDAITTALFEGGQRGVKSLRDSVVAAFRNKINVTIDATINAALSDFLGGKTGGSSKGGSSGGNIADIFKLGKEGYNKFFGEGSSAGTAAMGARETTDLAGVWGGSTEAVDAYELQGLNSLTSSTSTVTSSMQSLGQGLGYLNSAVAASKGKWGEAAGGAIGTYFGGPVGALIGSGIGSMVDSTFGSGANIPKTEGGYSNLGGKEIYSYGGNESDLRAKSLVESLTKGYSNLIGLTGSKGTLTGSSWISVDPKGTSSTQLDLRAAVNGKEVYNRDKLLGGIENVGKSDKELQAAVALSTSTALIEALKATDLSPALNKYLEPVTTTGKSIEELTLVLNNVTATAELTKYLKDLPFKYLKDMSVEASVSLLKASGGLSSLSSSLGSYYEKFYNEDEKTANLTKATSEAFGKLGVVMPELNDKTRAWYKSEVERLGATDLSIESNAKAYYGVLSLANAVDQLVPSIVKVRTQIEILTNIEKLKTDNASLQIQLLTAQGKTREALAATRLAELNKLTEAEKVLSKQNYALEDSIKAAAKALSEKTSLQDELNKLTLDSNQLAAIQRALLDKSNHVLFDQVQAIKVMQAATIAYVAEQKKVITAAYDAQVVAIKASLTSVDTSISNLTSLASALKDAIVSSSVIDTTTRVQAQAQLTKALATAQSGGGLPLITDLKSALSTVSKPSEGLFSTLTDYQRDLFKTNTTLTQLSDLTDSQLSIQEQQKIILTDSLAVLKTGFDSQIDKLDELITASALQLAAANLLNTLIAPKPVNTGTGSTTTTSGGISNGVGGGSAGTVQGKKGDGSGNFYAETGYGAGKDQQQVYDTSAIAKYASIQSAVSQIGADPAALAEYAKANNISQNMLATATGYMYSDIQALFNNAGIPSFDVGTNFIPEDMTAQVHKGERIIPAADNQALMDRLSNPQENSSALLEEVKRLREVVENQSYELQAIAGHTAKASKILVRVTPDGDAIATRVAV